MKHILFEENPSNQYQVAILLKPTSFNQTDLDSHYFFPLEYRGISPQNIIAFNLDYKDVKSAPVKLQRAYLSTLLPALESLGTKYLIVADTPYFKTLTGMRKVEPCHGYVLPCKIKGFEHIHVILSVNYQALFYNPDLQERLDLSFDTLVAHYNGKRLTLGQDIIHTSQYPTSLESIAEVLCSLHKYPTLTCDIETFSLHVDKAGIGTIAFAWDKHNGISFAVDYVPNKHPLVINWYGHQETNKAVRALLVEFFSTYKGTLIWHNANFDAKILIYTLFMEHPLDMRGLIHGLELLTKNIEDTKLIAYLATNSCSGNNLKLKYLAHAFAGDYAQDDIKDIRKIPLKELLEYNLVDCLATWYVKEKYSPIMIADNQEAIYREIFLPSIKVLLHTELCGMPMDRTEVLKVEADLIQQKTTHLNLIENSPLIKDFNLILQKEEMLKKNLLLKVKVKPLEDFADYVFNPASGPQMQKLLYEFLGFEVTDFTKKKQPAVGGDTINKLKTKLINQFGITEEEIK